MPSKTLWGLSPSCHFFVRDPKWKGPPLSPGSPRWLGATAAETDDQGGHCSDPASSCGVTTARPFTDGEMQLFLGCSQTEAVGGQCQGLLGF